MWACAYVPYQGLNLSLPLAFPFFQISYSASYEQSKGKTFLQWLELVWQFLRYFFVLLG